VELQTEEEKEAYHLLKSVQEQTIPENPGETEANELVVSKTNVTSGKSSPRNDKSESANNNINTPGKHVTSGKTSPRNNADKPTITPIKPLLRPTFKDNSTASAMKQLQAEARKTIRLVQEKSSVPRKQAPPIISVTPVPVNESSDQHDGESQNSNYTDLEKITAERDRLLLELKKERAEKESLSKKLSLLSSTEQSQRDDIILQLQDEITDMTADIVQKDEFLQKMASELNRLCDVFEDAQQEITTLTDDNFKLGSYVTQLEQDVQFLQEDIDEQLKLRDQEVDQIMGDVECLVAKLQELGCKVLFSEDGLVFS